MAANLDLRFSKNNVFLVVVVVLLLVSLWVFGAAFAQLEGKEGKVRERERYWTMSAFDGRSAS